MLAGLQTASIPKHHPQGPGGGLRDRGGGSGSRGLRDRGGWGWSGTIRGGGIRNVWGKKSKQDY